MNLVGHREGNHQTRYNGSGTKDSSTRPLFLAQQLNKKIDRTYLVAPAALRQRTTSKTNAMQAKMHSPAW